MKKNYKILLYISLATLSILCIIILLYIKLSKPDKKLPNLYTIYDFKEHPPKHRPNAKIDFLSTNILQKSDIVVEEEYKEGYYEWLERKYHGAANWVNQKWEKWKAWK